MADDDIVQCPICHGGGQISWDDTPDGLFPNLPLEGDAQRDDPPGVRRNGRGKAALGRQARDGGMRARRERPRRRPATEQRDERVASCSRSLDHLVGQCHQLVGDFEVERLGSLEVENK
jgi:hypothetical protein